MISIMIGALITIIGAAVAVFSGLTLFLLTRDIDRELTREEWKSGRRQK